MSAPNIYTADFEHDPDDPPIWASGVAEVGQQAGGKDLNVRLFEITPGAHLCPFHYEYIEEWLIVLEGSVSVRGANGTTVYPRGAVVCFPAGPAGVHQVSNVGGEVPARVLMFSADEDPGIAVYPDSDKLSVFSRHEPDKVTVRRSAPSSHLDYFDGETGAAPGEVVSPS